MDGKKNNKIGDKEPVKVRDIGKKKIKRRKEKERTKEKEKTERNEKESKTGRTKIKKNNNMKVEETRETNDSIGKKKP